MDQPTPQPQPVAVVVKPNYFKLGLAWAISLLILFVLIYVVSRAWKKGQAPA
jgi:hypothetical protein